MPSDVAKKFSAFNYKYVLANKYIWTGYRETLIRTIAGTALRRHADSDGAYAFKKLPNRILDYCCPDPHVFFRRYDTQLSLDG